MTTRLTLVLGDDEFLSSRAVSSAVTAARATDADADVHEYDSKTLGPEAFIDMASPSLFGDTRIVVVREAADLSDDTRVPLAAFVAGQPDDVVLVIAHAGGNKGKKLVEACKQAGAHVIACQKLSKPGDRLAFVQAEFHAAGAEVTAGACKAVLEAVGNDLRELAGACSQLAADAPGIVDEDVVGRYFRGRADASGFVVADRAVEGDSAGALAELRFAAAAGVAPVLVVSALSAQIRTIARVASAGRLSADTIARDLKMPPWRIDKARRQMRGWTPESLVEAHAAVARADAEVKGGGTDPSYALVRAVLAVARGKGR
ncbi:MAG: DNA polymerase III subunit delta [Mycobacteriales bacterium]